MRAAGIGRKPWAAIAHDAISNAHLA